MVFRKILAENFFYKILTLQNISLENIEIEVEHSVYFVISMHLINEFTYSCLIVLHYIFFIILNINHFLNCFSHILNLYRALSRNICFTVFIGFSHLSDDG